MGVVEMKEFRHSAFALKKITMLSAPAPTFFSFKTFLIPLSRTSISRKKKAQTQMVEKPNKFDPFGQKESAHLIYHTIAPLKVLVMGVNFILPF